ncbi:uncharacterized protein B0P05DRAFT_548955 [Gilbertella persicaria]|uniref:Uncharacterized protein n=1 Tax=Rhizopus stolonifer TaxID=4846 RepID=A0A367KJX8_RHIST|nr:uncharacterized protein B0P05DRAFT_548955 [Gilbertella persicaria]KAI8073529.1 hypothetical protein B0P05DRAFT_548955 [Gilbertella persicaria]RCI02535.1 hypothetical protein CU098_008646 [Rhizopus stolonifer]
MSSYLWKKKVTEPEIKLPERDALVLEKYTARMKRFDELVKICCCWIGYDVLLEFIPVVGKVISLIYALSMYRLACQCELPRTIKRRMLYHLSIDFLLGLIPILGILLDMLYRAHSKNARILRRFLYERARQGTIQAEKAALQTAKDQNVSEPTSVLMERDRQKSQ